MIHLPLAHVGGIPVEETLASFTPALLLAFGAASATLRARLRQLRSRATHEAPRRTSGRAARVGRRLR